MNLDCSRGPHRGALLIPAFNEQESLPRLLQEIREQLPGWPTIVMNDGSMDHTAAVARFYHAEVLDLVCNLGVGGAVQTGIQYALAAGYDPVVRLDGDGQHPPEEVPKLLQAAGASDADLIVGTRFGGTDVLVSSRLRYVGIRLLALMLSLMCRTRITDPTSGFWVIKRPLMVYFAHHFPTDYPEPEALALLYRQGYSSMEVPVRFRRRTSGVSSIHRWGAVYYALKVGLALVVDRVRPINPLFDRAWTHLPHEPG